jgi:beta-glucosidase
LEKIADKISRYYRVKLLGNKIRGFEDYFGIDYYRLGKIIYDRKNSEHLGFRIEEDKENIMGWIPYPRGIYEVLKEAYAYKKLPIYILENGIPTDSGMEDGERIRFIKEHLAFVLRSIREGVDIRGYFHWSLMDNFEWLDGFRPRFGLVEIDYDTLERKPRKSFFEYKKIIENNGLE